MPDLRTNEERRAEGRALREAVPRSVARGVERRHLTGPIRCRCSRNGTGRACATSCRSASGACWCRRSRSCAARPRSWQTTSRGTPTTGLRVQACGDAHLLNFGVFATPERNLVFDVNDFDETLPSPWEWDVKRLAASIVVAGRSATRDRAPAGEAVRNMVWAYRQRMAQLATIAPLEVWYERIDVDAVLALARKQRMLVAAHRRAAWWQQRPPSHQPGGVAQADRAGRRRAPDHRGSAAHPARRPRARRAAARDRGVRRVDEPGAAGAARALPTWSTPPGRSWGSGAWAPGATWCC